MTLRITGHGGVGEIGGNCFEVEAGGRRVLLDFGVSFKRYGDAFAEFLKPRKVAGIGDWLLAGVAPDLPGIYRQDYRGRTGARPEDRGVDAVLISHPHMDHIGLVPLLRPDIPVVTSATAYGVAKAVEETGGSFDEQDFTTFTERFRFRENRQGGLSKETRATAEAVERPWHRTDRLDLDGLTAHLLPVDHSIHGARGILLEGEAHVAYSGDLRLHGRNRHWTEKWVERCGGVDVLLVEGTNVSAPEAGRKPRVDDGLGLIEEFRSLGDMSETGVESYIAEGVDDEDGYVFVAYPQRDLDRLESFVVAARKAGRRLCLTPKQAYLLETLHGVGEQGLDTEIPGLGDPDVRIYLPRKGWGLIEREDLRADHPALVRAEYAKWEHRYLDHPATVTRQDIREDPGRYMVFADMWNLTELHEFEPRGGTYVHSKTEPFNEEMVQDRRRLLWWLRRWGLKTVAAHVSGHAPLDELLWMADQTGARRVVPIHTEDPGYYAKRLGPRAVTPRAGAPLDLG